MMSISDSPIRYIRPLASTTSRYLCSVTVTRTSPLTEISAAESAAVGSFGGQLDARDSLEAANRGAVPVARSGESASCDRSAPRRSARTGDQGSPYCIPYGELVLFSASDVQT